MNKDIKEHISNGPVYTELPTVIFLYQTCGKFSSYTQLSTRPLETYL